MNLAGRSVLVTGGAGGLGQAIVATLTEAGATVAVLDRVGVDPLPGVVPMTVDLCDAAAVESVVEHCFATLPPPCALVNNAGVIHSEPLGDMFGRTSREARLRRWSEVRAINLDAVFSATMAFVDRMLQQRLRGAVVNISSVSARGIAGQSAYAATKAGVEALALTWSKELAPLGIRACAVAPGFFDTPSTHAALSADHLRTIAGEVPLRRLGSPAEVAAVVRMAIENDYLNGVVIPVHGGLSV